MKRALIAGSFDPITNGHIDIIKRTSNLFDEVYVSIGDNIDKEYLLKSNRFNIVKDVLSNIPNVIVTYYTGLLSEYAYHLNIDCIVRGIRNSSDYDYETILSMTNKDNTDIDTLYLPCKPEYTNISSSMVKSIVNSGGFVHKYVPLIVKMELERLILNRKYLAIVGGSGTGKTSIAQSVSNKIDAYHIDLDKLVHEIYESNDSYCMKCKELMGRYFGTAILNDDMSINRKLLAQKVFSNKQDLAVLNELIKKPLRHLFYNKVKNVRNKLIIVEGATIIESGFIKYLNNNCILLKSNEDVATKRIINRDNISLSNARSRLDSQTTYIHKKVMLDNYIKDDNCGFRYTVDTSSTALNENVTLIIHKIMDELLFDN